MGYYWRTDGLTSYYADDSGDIKERSHTTAYTQASSTLEYTATNLYNGTSGITTPGTCGLWFSSDGTKLFVVRTNLESGSTDTGFMDQFSLSTAWDLSTVNTTPVTTLTLPKGTEYPYWPLGTPTDSANVWWKGLEFASDGLSFYFLRSETNNYVSGYGYDCNTFKVDYTLSTAWTLSTATLSATTNIAISTVTGGNSYDGSVSMYHTMTGGELVICKGSQFMNLDSISDTTANFSSALGAQISYFFSDDETLLLGNATYTCASAHTKIDTNYVQATTTAFSGSLGNKTQVTACGYTLNVTYYHDGANTHPAIGDTVYTDAAGTIPLANNYYGRTAFDTFRITLGSGVVASIDLC